MAINKIKCNLCESKKYELVYKLKIKSQVPVNKDQYLISEADSQKPDKILKCNNCGLIFTEQYQKPQYYKDRYEKMIDDDYLKEEKGRRKASMQILKKIEKYKKNGRLLDVGCANGFFMDEAKRRGWEVYGIEPSHWAVSYAKKNLNLNDIKSSFKEADFSDNFFDVVVMSDVIEHLTDPKGTLKEVRRILKGSGILYLNTPNIKSLVSRLLKIKWWGINKFHLFYFSKKTLKKMLEECKFTVKKYTLHSRFFSIKYLAKRAKTYNKVVYKFLKFLLKIGRTGDFLLKVNFHDQLEVISEKSRSMDSLVTSLEIEQGLDVKKEKRKVFVVLPAYNAEKTLKKTVDDIPRDIVDKIILVDDNSSDATVEVAKKLNLEVFKHKSNMGYGANQKTCYEKALEQGADIVVMVHPDYQYDPTIIPKLVEPIQKGRADAVFGSRMMRGNALEGGMPLWKHNINILLTAFENVVLGTYLTEYHSGFRAYSAKLLKTINFKDNSNKFVFDTEIIVQILISNFKIEEVPIQTRYFDEASEIKLLPSIMYGFGIIQTMLKYILYSKGFCKFKQFESFDQ